MQWGVELLRSINFIIVQWRGLKGTRQKLGSICTWRIEKQLKITTISSLFGRMVVPSTKIGYIKKKSCIQGEDYKLCLGFFKLEMPLRYPCGAFQQAVKYYKTEFQGRGLETV